MVNQKFFSNLNVILKIEEQKNTSIIVNQDSKAQEALEYPTLKSVEKMLQFLEFHIGSSEESFYQG